MAQFKYEFLPAEEQAQIIEARLVTLERDRANLDADLKVAGSSAAPGQEQRLAEITAAIEELRAERKALLK